MEITQDLINEINELNHIHTSWRDYALLLLNSTPDPLRSIWREKVATSVSHWEFGVGSISEGNIAGVEILTVLPNDFTEMVVDDHFTEGTWNKENRLAGSKRMKMFLGRYPQESIANEARLCLEYIVNNYEEYGHLIQNTPLLKRMWDLAQKSQGNAILPDEVLTYLLEKPLDDSKYGVWMDVAEDIFENGIPSEKYKEYWKSGKIEGYPLSLEVDDTYMSAETNEEIPLDLQKKYFKDLIEKFLKEDVSMSPCWKKIAICILKNDVSFKYAGFSSTYKERLAREEAIAAFSTKQEEKEKAIAEAERLSKQMKKEKGL